MEHHNNVHIAKVAGSSASVTGFVLKVVGFGLSFVTFGASLILSVVGLGVGAAGGVTNAGSLIAQACFQKDTGYWSLDRWHCGQRRQRSFVSRSQCSRQGRSYWRFRIKRRSPTIGPVHFGNHLDRNRCSSERKEG